MKLRWRWRKPRINMIIGKKQIIIAGLTLLLGVAVFANYAVNANREVRPNTPESTAPNSPNGGGNTDENNANQGGNYGDTHFVNGGIDDDDVSAFFASARLSKRESRDEAMDFLQAIIAGGDVRGEEIQAIAASANNLGDFIESEARIEARLRAQGFADVLCYISDKGTNIIVRTDGLTAQCAAIIRDAIISEVDVAVENITIVEVN
ncbi:MAG: SpoIIIAH-like family protein [Oscillospiraceae bacterium]|nr:SpoIIIAH-like family protein [Oscillospiraceae bacterium]